MQHAMVAMLRLDKEVAAQRYLATRERFPNAAPAYGFGAMALRQLGRHDDAEALLSDAMTRFPNEPLIFVEFAQCAIDRNERDQALQRCRTVRDNFPERPEGWRMLSSQHALAGRWDEAEAVIGEGVKRHSDDRFVLIHWTVLAKQRKDWPEARRRWTAAKARLPELADVNIGIEEIATDGLDTPLAEARAASAATGPREFAIRKWRELNRRFPDVAEGYWRLSNELVRAGSLAEAEAIITDGIGRMPNDGLMVWQWARTATQRQDWPEAEHRWRVAKSRFPHWTQIDDGIGEMRLAIGLRGLDHGEVTGAVRIEPPARRDDSAPAQLLMRFESLGGNCEFGIVQRLAGIEPLGLLRWANITTANLLRALNSGLECVGHANSVRLEATQSGDYYLIDRYFGMHTFINPGKEPAEKLLPKMVRRLRFLRDKLLEDLAAGERIFVHKLPGTELDVDEIRALGKAIHRYGSGQLLVVQKASDDRVDGRVEMVGEGVFTGYLSKLTANPLAAPGYVADWYNLCQTAARLIDGDL